MSRIRSEHSLTHHDHVLTSFNIFKVVDSTILQRHVPNRQLATDDTVNLNKHCFSVSLGFKSYLGMLQVDVYHNHPVLRVYVEIMTRYLEQQRWQNMCIGMWNRSSYGTFTKLLIIE